MVGGTKPMVVGTNLCLREQNIWLGEQKPIVVGIKTYGYGNKSMVVGTNIWLWEQIYGCVNTNLW
jgi:hypothetical protein